MAISDNDDRKVSAIKALNILMYGNYDAQLVGDQGDYLVYEEEASPEEIERGYNGMLHFIEPFLEEEGEFDMRKYESSMTDFLFNVYDKRNMHGNWKCTCHHFTVIKVEGNQAAIKLHRDVQNPGA